MRFDLDTSGQYGRLDPQLRPEHNLGSARKALGNSVITEHELILETPRISFRTSLLNKLMHERQNTKSFLKVAGE
jgi:hypothetical protein